MPGDAPSTRIEPLDRPLDLHATLAPLRRGRGDRCMRIEGGTVLRATRSPEGPVTLRLRVQPGAGRLLAEAWGPGSGWALDHVRALVGADDDDAPLEAMLAGPGQAVGKGVLRALRRRLPGLRLPASGAVTETLVPTIIEQKVTGLQARRSYRTLVDRLGEPAPGPFGLRLPPAPEVLAATPSWVFHAAGIEGRRAATIVRACRVADRLDGSGPGGSAGVARRMSCLPGVGPWSVAEVTRTALGDPDALSVGDYHLHNQVTFALTGTARGDDARMLELLSPYAGQRGRIQRLVEAAGVTAPRFGPRLTVQAIEAI